MNPRPAPSSAWSRAATCLVLPCLALLGPASAHADAQTHVVASGDSLGAIAVRYHIALDRLRSINHLDTDTIRVGQELVVEDEPSVRYRAVPGDTLRCIAARHHIRMSRLLEDNPGVRRGRLHVGQVLTLRGASDPHERDPEASMVDIVVEEGDTLSAIAAAHASTVQAIVAANEGLDAERLVVGATLHIPGGFVTHTVQRGEGLARIARRYHSTVAQLRADNPGLRPRRLSVGSEVRVRGQSPSESIGSAACGHIVGATQLGEHPAYVLRNPDRSYATARTVARIRRGFDAVRRAHPRAARVRVHDLSLPNGGAIDDHRSHQSGRDVDITYYRRGGCSASDGCPLEDVEPAQLDVRRQWTLLRSWLQRDEVEAIYVDHSLHRVLYREARRRGATAAQLRRWFQHPRGRRDPDGVIRHFPNHVDHLHVRFACARGERRCR